MTRRLDPRSDRPLALQLADVLRAEIQEGVRRPGSQLPTEAEFQHGYVVSRTTIRSALSILVAEGLVVTRKGFGSYVRDRPPLRRISSTHRHASHRDSGKPEFDTEAIAQGQIEEARQLYLQALGVKSDAPDGHYGLATVCFLLSDLTSAAYHFKEVTRLDPLRAGAYIKGKFTDTNNLVIDPYIQPRPEAIAALGRLVSGGASLDARANAARAVGILRGRQALQALEQTLRSNDTDLIYESLVAIESRPLGYVATSDLVPIQSCRTLPKRRSNKLCRPAASARRASSACEHGKGMSDAI